jgi:hypothetical protein
MSPSATSWRFNRSNTLSSPSLDITNLGLQVLVEGIALSIAGLGLIIASARRP